MLWSFQPLAEALHASLAYELTHTTEPNAAVHPASTRTVTSLRKERVKLHHLHFTMHVWLLPRGLRPMPELCF